MRPFLILLGIALGGPLACSGRTASSTDPIPGAHTLDGTYVVTSTHDPTGAPGGFQPQLRVQEPLAVVGQGGSRYRITWKNDGTTFSAEAASKVLRAEDAVGQLDPRGAASATAGVVAITVRRLNWNMTSGLYQEVDDITTNLSGGGREISFIDGHVDGVSDGARQWLHYHAGTNYPWDFPHGDACMLGGSATTDGMLGVAYGPTHDELRVYLQGVGCEITASRASDGKFTADRAKCSLDPDFSIAVLGITSFNFESFSLDPASKQLSFVVRATRTRDNGQVVDLCLKLDSAVTGDFPQ